MKEDSKEEKTIGLTERTNVIDEEPRLNLLLQGYLQGHVLYRHRVVRSGYPYD